MPEPAELDRAKAGDAAAIARLLNQVFEPHGITVRGDRQDDCLVLWLESLSPPDRAWVRRTIRQGMQRLQVATLVAVQVHWWQPQQSDHWSDEIVLRASEGIDPQKTVAARAESERAELQDTNAEEPSADALPAVAIAPPPAPGAETGSEAATIARLERAYTDLRTNPAATLLAIDAAYARLKTELLRQGQRTAATELKANHAQFKANWQPAAEPASTPVPAPQAEVRAAEPVDEATAAIQTLVALMRVEGLPGQARLYRSQLQIRIDPGSGYSSQEAIAILYTLLERPELVALHLPAGASVTVYGMASPQKLGWKRRIPMPPPATTDNRDLASFNNRPVNTFGLPLLLLLGIGMNAIPLIDFLLRGIKIWFHEFGHATIAWLAGRKAIPLPFGWTNVELGRSPFVYLGLLFLFGLMFWAGRREHKRWPMVLAGLLMLLQFWFTWLLPTTQFKTLLSFGGIGGELYLCTLLMVSFYFPLPAYWRWDIYRYPVVLGAAFTFWGQFWLWRQINQGLADIPWGSMWGGVAHGDMNNLSNAGWSNQQIIGTYNTLAHLCLLTLLVVYGYFGMQQNRHYLFALYHRWLARGNR